LQLSSDGRYLSAVDRGSDQISVLRMRSDGSLDLVADDPVSWDGVKRVGMAIPCDPVYVANTGTPTSTDGPFSRRGSIGEVRVRQGQRRRRR
jgi:hypothetical protein